MRRSGLALAALLFIPAHALAAPPVDTTASDRKVAEMLASAHAVYGVPDPRARCKPSAGDEIVVCADHGEDLHVPSTADSDPNSREARRALDGGIPRAPQFDRGYCAQCQHFGAVPPPVYYVDVTKLPMPPAGSDAELIANGEAPAP